ncbi:MAG: FxDxF family PEP-CTERM protein [Azoarcus sp.]|jgi:hypothetical protein|nr:FxDxF family PEP-CTERM protein [Azoarcus sp.]
MQIKKIIATVALGLGFSAFAQAYDYGSLGTLTETDGVSTYGTSTFSGANPINDKYTFSVANGVLSGDVGFGYTGDYWCGGGCVNASIEIYKGSDLSAPAIFSLDSAYLTGYWSWGKVDFVPSVSDYTLVVKGTAIVNGTYSFWINAADTAPVPEPAEYAMLLAGLGVVGVVTRRKRARAAM